MDELNMTWAQYTQSVKEYRQELVWDGRSLGVRLVRNDIELVPAEVARVHNKPVCSYCGTKAHDHKGSGRCLACNAPL